VVKCHLLAIIANLGFMGYIYDEIIGLMYNLC